MSKILIVGSDEALVRQLTRLVAGEGHELAVASDGAAGSAGCNRKRSI